LTIPYRYLIKYPYWMIRKNILNIPISKTIGDTTADFVPDYRINNYSEFNNEKESIERVLSDIQDGDIFFDIGANIGMYSCFACRYMPQAKVVAFEPSPSAYGYLESNLDLNCQGYECLQVAVSDINSTIKFAVDKSDHLGRMSSLEKSSSDINYENIEIKSKKIDTLVSQSNLPKPDIVKIDVEGAEYRVLQGMIETMASARVIYCEIHHHRLNDFDGTRQDIAKLLSSHNYKVETIHTRGKTEFVRGHKKSN